MNYNVKKKKGVKNDSVPNSKQHLIDKIIKKYGEREVSHVSDRAGQFCVFRTEIELKPLDEELN